MQSSININQEFKKGMCFKTWSSNMLKNYSNSDKFNYLNKSVKDPYVKKVFSIFQNYDYISLDILIDTMSKVFKIQDIDFDNLHLINQRDEGFNDFFVYTIFKRYGLEKKFSCFSEEILIDVIIIGLLEEYVIILEPFFFKELSTLRQLIEHGIPIRKYDDLKNKRLKKNSCKDIQIPIEKLNLFESKMDKIITKIDEKTVLALN